MISSADVPVTTTSSLSNPIGQAISESTTNNSGLENNENKKGADSAASHRRTISKRKKSDLNIKRKNSTKPSETNQNKLKQNVD